MPRSARSGLGDTGLHAPQHWLGGFGTGADHVLVTLHALDPQALTTYSTRLSALFAEGHAFQELWRVDGMALCEIQNGKPVPVPKLHFGYTDGISQVTIKGGPEHYAPDHQEPCEPWLFVLLDEAENYYMPEPRELGRNGGFGVFKMIRQDVVGFEQFLHDNNIGSTPNCWRPKSVGAGAMGFPWCCPQTPMHPHRGSP